MGEYLWRLDPNDPALFQDISLIGSASSPFITYHSQLGYRYRIETSSNLTDWALFGTSTGVGGLSTAGLPLGTGRLFWRVRLDL